MSNPIEVMAALAGLATFSVGFLTVRIHAMRDQALASLRAVSSQIVERSFSGSIDAGDMLSLALEADEPDDPIGRVTLYLNRLLLVLGAAVAIHGLVAEAISGTDAAYSLCLFGAQVLVTLLGEYDVRYVRSSLQEGVQRSIAGRLRLFGRTLEHAAGPGLRRGFEEISRDVPDDDAREQLDALVSLHEGDTAKALASSAQLARSGRCGTIGWQVGVAASVRCGDLVAGHRLASDAASAENRNRLSLDEVGHALALLLGEAEALLSGGPRSYRDWLGGQPWGGSNPRTLGATPWVPHEVPDLLRLLLEYRVVPMADAALEPLRAHPVGGLLAAARLLATGSELPDPAPDGTEGYREAYSWLLVAGSDTHRALEFVTGAAQTDPLNPRLHVLLACVYSRLGWTGQAEASLTRARVLRPEDSLVAIATAMVREPGRRDEFRHTAVTDLSAWPTGLMAQAAASFLGVTSIESLPAPDPTTQPAPQWLTSLIACSARRVSGSEVEVT